MSNNTANTIKNLMSNTSTTKRISLYTQHLYWKAGKLCKNLMVGMLCLANFILFTVAGAFMFWVKLQIVIWMFG